MPTEDRQYQYDVAISFLHQDEPLALQLNAKLSENFNVFVYSKRQEELAGTDGLESFRQAFLSDSRLVVALFRDGWGKTRWTRIEEAAIKDRFFDEGWEWLLFVNLARKSTKPPWLPESRIWLDFAEYGVEQLIGAIKERAQRLGSAMKVETAVDQAKRLDEEIAGRKERERLLSEQGHSAASQEFQKFIETLNGTIEQLRTSLSTIALEAEFDGRVYVCRTQNVSMNLWLHLTNPVTDSRIVSREWIGKLSLQSERHLHYLWQPQTLSERAFYFDYQVAYGWCWHLPRSSDRILPTAALAEHIIKQLLDLHGRAEKGEIKRKEPKLYPGSSGPGGWMAH